jgi:hypothetical protein
MRRLWAVSLAFGVAAGLAGCAMPLVGSSVPPVENADLMIDFGAGRKGTGGVIVGLISDASYPRPAAGVLVVLQSYALPRQREQMTDERGVYRFENLPPGNYTIQVLWGKSASKVVELLEDGRFRANFSVNPERDCGPVVIMSERPPIDFTSASSTYGSWLVEYD